MILRPLLPALLLTLALGMPTQAGYSFFFSAGPPPGPGGQYGSVTYASPNNVYGAINANYPYGIQGINTPLNAGRIFSESGVSFGINGNSGSLSIGRDFSAVITGANVGSGGGSFEFQGYLTAAAASYFGISPDTLLAGGASLGLSTPGIPGGNGNRIGSLTAAFAPAVPEPASVIATASGIIIALGYARGRRRRIAG